MQVYIFYAGLECSSNHVGCGVVYTTITFVCDVHLCIHTGSYMSAHHSWYTCEVNDNDKTGVAIQNRQIPDI